MPNAPRKTLQDLLAVMAALRTPVTGCPWDLEQNFQSIAPYTIEEAYEVADAIERGDLVDLQEELGDLLLQVVYHAQLAQEQGAFDFGDVAHGITVKMTRRHPHVFGDETARTAGMAKGAWERIKGEEKAAKAAARAARLSSPLVGEWPRGAEGLLLASRGGGGEETASLLDDVPRGMTALTRAVKLQDKAAKVGFDWPSLAPVLAKMKEEMAELEEALTLGARPSGSDVRSAAPQPQAAPSQTGVRSAGAGTEHHVSTPIAYDDRLAGTGTAPTAEIEEEFGDLLFVMANVARHLKIDPEAALRGANAKFTRRFRHIEGRLAEQRRTPLQSTLEEMDELWNEAKRGEKA